LNNKGFIQLNSVLKSSFVLEYFTTVSRSVGPMNFISVLHQSLSSKQSSGADFFSFCGIPDLEEKSKLLQQILDTLQSSIASVGVVRTDDMLLKCALQNVVHLDKCFLKGIEFESLSKRYRS